MTFIYSSPDDTSAGQYDKRSFDMSIANGPMLYAIREIYRNCMEAIASGRIKYWFPSKVLDENYVNNAVSIIDEEYEKEVRRDPKYMHGPQFSKNLSWVQKACLVEQIQDTIKKYELIPRIKDQYEDHF